MKEKENCLEKKIEDVSEIAYRLHSILTKLKIVVSELVLLNVEKHLIDVLSIYIKAEVKSNIESISIAKRYLRKNESNIMKAVINHFDNLYHYEHQNCDFVISNLDKLMQSKMVVVKLKPLTNDMLKPFSCTTLILKERSINIDCDGSILIKQELPESFIECTDKYKKQLMLYQKHRSELAAIYWHAASMAEEKPNQKNCFLTFLRKVCCWLSSAKP